MELGMKTWILAGAIALAAAGSLGANFSTAHAAGIESNRLTEVNIAQIRGLLKLTAEQIPLWNRVEGVLITVAREQAQDNASLIRRISRRAVMVAFDGIVTQRIKNAALPLLASLSEEQKTTVRSLAQRMGIGEMVVLVN
jgi:hypothetical protein